MLLIINNIWKKFNEIFFNHKLHLFKSKTVALKYLLGCLFKDLMLIVSIRLASVC